MAEQDASAVAITGGSINGTTVGATTPAAGTFTTLTAQTEVLKGTGQNLFIRSQAFSIWCTGGSSNVTGTDNVTTAPDGTTTASSVVPTVTNGLHRTYSPIAVSVTQGATYTMSVYAKANGYRYLFFNTGTTGGTAVFDVQAGTVTNGTATSSTITAVTGATGWYRLTLTGNATSTGIPPVYWQIQSTFAFGDQTFAGDGTSGIYLWGAQLELSSTVNTYIPTTTTAVYGTPTLSFSGVAGIGLQSDGSLYVQPAGTGALQAQATTSTATGGNARGANAVDWQTARATAAQVASGANGVIGGGYANIVNNQFGGVLTGYNNTAGYLSGVLSGQANQAYGTSHSVATGGWLNVSNGYWNFVGGGYANSGTSSSTVTTQATTTVTSGSTAVTLSGSNASIKVGQYILGTGIANPTFVAAISGTSLTLSQNASGSGSPTLSFFTPHGVVVGGGNNQATGSYSFIGGGGDAGTAANRNVASGDWSFVGGGAKNTASGLSAVVAGGGVYNGGVSGNTASGVGTFVGGGFGNQATNTLSAVLAGDTNFANGYSSTIVGGRLGTSRAITGYTVFPACYQPVASGAGVSQAALIILGRQTTDATATVLCSDTSAASASNQVILPNNSAYYFKGEVVAGVTGGGNTKGWTVEGVIKRGANAASTAIVGTATVLSNYADAGAATWALTATADTTNGGLAITFTGQAATTIRCVAQITTTEMTY
jgi:hypothetical protein